MLRGTFGAVIRRFGISYSIRLRLIEVRVRVAVRQLLMLGIGDPWALGIDPLLTWQGGWKYRPLSDKGVHLPQTWKG